MGFNIFKKKMIRYLGRSGVLYRHKDDDFIIDTEMSFVGGIDIVVFKDSVQYKDKNRIISEAIKCEVLSSLVKYLKSKERLQVKIM